MAGLKAELWHTTSDGTALRDREGHALWCEEHESIWCDHISGWLAENGDSPSLFEEERLKTGPHVIVVPMFPTVGVFADVHLFPITDYPVPAFWVDGPFGARMFSLAEGEGRLSIRSSLHQLFLAEDDPTIECSSKNHGYKEEMTYQKNMKTDRGHAERWCIRVARECLRCYQTSRGILGADDDFSDLVPEKERSGWNA